MLRCRPAVRRDADFALGCEGDYRGTGYRGSSRKGVAVPDIEVDPYVKARIVSAFNRTLDVTGEAECPCLRPAVFGSFGGSSGGFPIV